MRRGLLQVLALSLFLRGKEGAAAPVERVDPLVGLAQHQREACESPARRKIFTGGRRSGKTEAVVARMCQVAISGGEVVYISLTRKLAKKTVWKRLKKRLRLLSVAAKANESELKLELPGDGSIELGGADDSEAIERYRGPAYALVVIDECGSQPTRLLHALVTDVLRPALMDFRGELIMAGTPGPTLGGFWFEQAGPDGLRRANHPIWRWTIHHNPLFLGRAEAELEEVLEENGWSRESVTFRREYLGEWVQDDSVLVYPYTHARNGIGALPERTARGYLVSTRRWRHVIGVDVGTTKDAMAIVVLASHPALRDDFMVHAEAHTGLLIDGLIGRLRALLRRFPHATIVVDSGGMGAAHALDLANAGLPIVPAKKTDKAAAIRKLHDHVLGGRLKLLTIPALDGVRKEWAALGWDEDHLQHHPDQPDHYSDATLYALRELRHWFTREDMERPPLDPFKVDIEEVDDGDELEHAVH